MKKITIVSSLLTSVLILGSCSTSNDVVSNRLISKRKYNRGFHVDMKKHHRTTKDELADQKMDSSEKSIQVEPKKETVKSLPISTSETYALVPVVTSGAEEAVKVSSDKAVEVTQENQKESNEVSASDKATRNTFDDSETKNMTAKLVKKEASKKEAEKQAFKEVKKKKKSLFPDSVDAMFLVALICCIIIPPLGVAIYTNIDWVKVLICLILTILFIIPGIIYALLVLFDVL
ncbi:MAG: YqaE/Pmp3 family membrane protein [Crocinitomicaceae bacterium]|nr:YqaE/Pmp3 family membrane protein [Crocinitomicaceae bacterium]